jgi:hypothetical protein
MEKKIKKYTIEIIHENGQLKMNRTNDGFTLWELIAFSEIIKNDLLKILTDEVPVNEIKRNIIID